MKRNDARSREQGNIEQMLNRVLINQKEKKEERNRKTITIEKCIRNKMKMKWEKTLYIRKFTDIMEIN